MNLVEKGKSAELKKVLQASQQQLECQVIDISDSTNIITLSYHQYKTP